MCLVDIQRNESVQGLMRGVPWTPVDDAETCKECQGPNCPKKCIFPEKALPPGNRLWHRDGFLHFWPPYASPYNLNPYARFVHNKDTGLDAPGAYSFSIDDFYGNFGGPGSTLIIEVGGTDHMPNQEPFNPYKQYSVAWGTGWHHARVCNRLIPDASKVRNVPTPFWQDGKPIESCDITLYATEAETGPTALFARYQIKEVKYTVTDTYTGLTHEVAGLSGIYAARLGTPQEIPNEFCVKNSTQFPPGNAPCNGNLTSAGADIDLPVNVAYVAVSDAACQGLTIDKTDVLHVRQAAHPREPSRSEAAMTSRRGDLLMRGLVAVVLALLLGCGVASAQTGTSGSGASSGPFSVSAEALVWWLKGSPTPVPLITDGLLDESGTKILLGGGDLDTNPNPGFRVTAGYALNERWGLEGATSTSCRARRATASPPRASRDRPISSCRTSTSTRSRRPPPRSPCRRSTAAAPRQS